MSMEYEYQMYLYQKCNCEHGDDQGDDFNKEYCEYDCFSQNKNNEAIHFWANNVDEEIDVKMISASI